MSNRSKLTRENVKAFVTALQNGMTQLQISKETGISPPTLSIWKRRALSDEPLTGEYVLLQPLRDFFRRDNEPEENTVRGALIKAVTSDRVTTTEKVTEIVKLTPSQREVLDTDLIDAFDAGEVVLVKKVTTITTESPDPVSVMEAHRILFPDEDGAGDTD